MPRLAIGISTADCGPLLLADAEAGVIGAAHAGWRGALTGVIEATIAAMEKLGAERSRITAALGPIIRQPNYEVGPEFVERFLAADADNARFFAPSERAGHALFDLAGYHRQPPAARRHRDVSRISACAPMPSPSASSATAARPSWANPITADISTRSHWPTDACDARGWTRGSACR